VLRVLTLTRLIDVFPLHATVDEAAGRSRHMAAVPVLPRRPSLASWPRAAMRSAARALAGERRPPGKQAEAAEVLPHGRMGEPVSIPDGFNTTDVRDNERSLYAERIVVSRSVHRAGCRRTLGGVAV